MTRPRTESAVRREAGERLTRALQSPKAFSALSREIRGMPLPAGFLQGWLSLQLSQRTVRSFEVEGEPFYVSGEDAPQPTQTPSPYPTWMQPTIALPTYGLRTIYRDGQAVLAFTRPDNKRSAPCKPPPKPTRTARRV